MAKPGFSTEIGFVNRNRQRNTGQPDPPREGTDHNQRVYILRCLKCEEEYGANGSDIHARRCPSCQGGRPGI